MLIAQWVWLTTPKTHHVENMESSSDDSEDDHQLFDSIEKAKSSVSQTTIMKLLIEAVSNGNEVSTRDYLMIIILY